MNGATVHGWGFPGGGQAFYKGLAVCGSVWTCAICACRISEKRRAELAAAVERTGYSMVLVSITLQHDKSDHLAELLDSLNDGTRRMKQGRWWKDFSARYQLKASVTSLEITYGGSGWHPHKHWLLFCDLPQSEIDQEGLQAELTTRYKAILAKHGRYASDLYGINVRIGHACAGSYVSKWGLDSELVKASTKEGREGGFSPFQLLDLYQAGDKQAGALFVEYSKATEGKRQLVYSRGARQVLGLAVAEKTDQELAAAEEETENEPVLLFALNRDGWKKILQHGARTDLLDVADSGDQLKIIDFLENLGIKEGEYYVENCYS
jgi:hypothetical protein